MRTQNILVREAEWQLGTDAYLLEQEVVTTQWPYCEFLYQQMFLHATTTGCSEHNCAIWREHSPEQDLGVEPTAVELIGPDSMHQDIEDLYQDVYQLQRLPGRGWCEEATKDHLHKEILG